MTLASQLVSQAVLQHVHSERLLASFTATSYALAAAVVASVLAATAAGAGVGAPRPTLGPNARKENVVKYQSCMVINYRLTRLQRLLHRECTGYFGNHA